MTQEINLEEVRYLFYKYSEKEVFQYEDVQEVRNYVDKTLKKIVKNLGFNWDDVKDFVNTEKKCMRYVLRTR